jgi:hypothetical protein
MAGERERLALGRVRVVRFAPGWGFSAGEWEGALARVEWEGAERLKVVGRGKKTGTADERTRVWRCEVEIGGRARRVVVKVEEMGSVRRRVAAALGWSRARAQWRGAEVLTRRGMRAARGCVVLGGVAEGVGRVEVLVMEAVGGRTVLEWAARGEGVEEVAREVGRWWAGMARAGVRLRDGKGSNLVVSEGEDGARGVVVVDTGGAVDGRSGRWTRERASWAMAQVVLECVGCGVLPRRSVLVRAVREFVGSGGAGPWCGGGSWDEKQEVRALWRAVRGKVQGHGDARPVDDPMAGDLEGRVGR